MIGDTLNMAETYRYIEEFKRDYRKYGNFDLERQIPHLAGLADHYTRRYHKTKNWSDCLKVSTQVTHNSFSQEQAAVKCVDSFLLLTIWLWLVTLPASMLLDMHMVALVMILK